MELLYVLIWIGVSCAVGSAASSRFNRSGFGWFLVSCLISPLIAGPLLLVVGPLKPQSHNWERIDWSGQSQTKSLKPTRSEATFFCCCGLLAFALFGLLIWI